MNKKVLMSLVLLVAAGAVFAQQAVDFNGNRYERIDQDMSWADAKAYAESLGGHLATITSEAEWNAIKGLVTGAPMKGYYIGAEWSPSTKSYQWITGERWTEPTWVKFSRSSPNDGSKEPAIAVWRAQMNWQDVHGRKEGLGLIVEFE